MRCPRVTTLCPPWVTSCPFRFCHISPQEKVTVFSGIMTSEELPTSVGTFLSNGKFPGLCSTVADYICVGRVQLDPISTATLSSCSCSVVQPFIVTAVIVLACSIIVLACSSIIVLACSHVIVLTRSNWSCHSNLVLPTEVIACSIIRTPVELSTLIISFLRDSE